MSYGRPLFWATAVLTGGIAASLAGNLQAINLDNANPGVGAHISAIWWPLSLFGVAELLIHTPWLATWRDNLTKLATVTLVAAVAAWVSYWHLANVLSHYGYDVASRYAGPVAIDAAMVLATLAMDRIGQARRLAKAGHVDTILGQPHPVSKDAPEGWTDRLDKPAVDTGPSMSSVQASTWQDDGHGHEAADCPDMSNVQALDTGHDKPNVHAPTMVDVDKALANYLAGVDKPANGHNLWLVQDGEVSNGVDMDTTDVHDWTERLANLEPMSTPMDSEEDMFVRLEREMTNRPPLAPADIPVSPAPAGRARPSRMTAEQSAQALEYARVGREHHIGAVQIAEALAAWAGVSTRTVRRLPWWTPLMQGSQAS